MDDTARTQRGHSAMDAMRPSQAFGAPPAPSTHGPWHVLRQLFRTLRDASALMTRRRPHGDTSLPCTRS